MQDMNIQPVQEKKMCKYTVDHGNTVVMVSANFVDEIFFANLRCEIWHKFHRDS